MKGAVSEKEKTSRVSDGANGNGKGSGSGNGNGEFSEAQKVISVFGSQMQKDNVVRASNTNRRM